MPFHYTYDEDNSGRRSSIDRRQFTYTVHIPERRIVSERRAEKDRRNFKQQSRGRVQSNSWFSERVIIFPTSNTKG